MHTDIAYDFEISKYLCIHAKSKYERQKKTSLHTNNYYTFA